MSELSTYAFRADKAKTAFPDPTDVAMLKNYMMLPIYQTFEIDVPAHSMNQIKLYQANTTYPVPILQLRTIRKRDDHYTIIFGGVTICLYGSRILDDDGQPGAREVSVFVMNNGDVPVTAYCIALWFTKPFGTPYEIGPAWENQFS